MTAQLQKKTKTKIFINPKKDNAFDVNCGMMLR